MKKIIIILSCTSFFVYASAGSFRHVATKLPSMATICRLAKAPIVQPVRPNNCQRKPIFISSKYPCAPNAFYLAISAPLFIEAVMYFGVKTFLPLYFIPRETYREYLERTGKYLPTCNNQFE